MNFKKQKKVVATFLLSTLALSSNLYAYSTSRVDKTVIVKTQDVLDETNAPNLKIELHDPVIAGDKFYLTLKGAKWHYADGEIESYLSSHITTDAADTTVTFRAVQQSSTIVEIEIVTGTIEDDETISIPMMLKVTGSKPTVTVDSICNITEDTVTLARVNDSGFTVSVDDDVNSFYDNGQLASFTISEAALGSFEDNCEGDYLNIYLYLDSSEFDLVNYRDIKLSFSKGLAGISASAYSISPDSKQDNTYIISVSKSVLSSDMLNVISVEGIKISANDEEFSSAKVDLDVSIGATTKTITIGEIVNEGLIVKVTPETKWKGGLPAGRKSSFTASIKEGAKDAVTDGKNFSVELEKGYFMEVDVTRSKTQILSSIQSEIIVSSDLEITNFDLTGDKITGITFCPVADDDSYDEYKIKFPYTSFTDGIVYDGSENEDFTEYVNFTGRALISDQRVKLGDIEVPFNITYTEAQLKLGERNQVAPEITITESLAGAFQKGTLEIYFNNEDGVRFSSVPKVEVTSGNIKVGTGKLLKSGNKVYGLSVPIISVSKEVSTFKISEVSLLTDQTAASGSVDICLGGTAITDDEAFVAEKYVNIAGVSSYEQNQFTQMQNQLNEMQQQSQTQEQKNLQVAMFTIDQTAYNVNGQTKVTDGSVPYIESGRTYVPLRYAAEAVGITGQDLQFGNSIATLMGTKIVQLKVDSEVLYINGVKLQMDVTTILKDGRCYLPVYWIAQALDIESQFDSATKRVYLYSKGITFEQAKAIIDGGSLNTPTTTTTVTPTPQVTPSVEYPTQTQTTPVEPTPTTPTTPTVDNTTPSNTQTTPNPSPSPSSGGSGVIVFE